MWPGADPDVIVSAFRHTESKANVENANFGDRTPLSDKGQLQVPYIFERMVCEGVELILCSPADRAYLPVSENAEKYGIPFSKRELLNEFRRPSGTIGRSNDDPEVREILDRRIAEFGTAHKSLDGEETFIDTVLTVSDSLDQLRSTALSEKVKHVGLLLHGLRLRQIEAFILAQGDWEQFAWLFKSLYRIEGYENGGYMHFWYGYPFRESPKYKRDEAKKCWNIERGDVSHIPKHLR